MKLINLFTLFSLSQADQWDDQYDALSDYLSKRGKVYYRKRSDDGSYHKGRLFYKKRADDFEDQYDALADYLSKRGNVLYKKQGCTIFPGSSSKFLVPPNFGIGETIYNPGKKRSDDGKVYYRKRADEFEDQYDALADYLAKRSSDPYAELSDYLAKRDADPYAALADYLAKRGNVLYKKRSGDGRVYYKRGLPPQFRADKR